MNSLAPSLNRIAETWWEYVVNASWQAALVGLCALVLLRIGPRWPAPWRCGLLLVALLKFACPPMIAAPTGLFSQWAAADWGLAGDAEELPSDRAAPPAIRSPAPPAPEEFAEDSERQDSLPPAGNAEPVASAFANDSDSNDIVPTLAHVKSGRGGAVAIAFQSQIADPQIRLHWRAGLMLLHLAGVLLFACWIAGQLRRLRGVIRNSREIVAGPHYEQLLALCRTMKLRRTPRLLETQHAVTPMALGIWRPTVVIPTRVLEGLAPADVRTVLAHELAHLRRGDAWLNWLRIVLLAVWWFHPVAWLLSRALRHVHEDCCDDMLLAGGLIGEADYCQTLLRVAAKASGGGVGLALGMAQRLHPLGHRLLRIMDNRARRRASLSAGGLGALVLLAGVLLPGLSRRPVDAAPAESHQRAAKDAESENANQVAQVSQVAEAPSAEPANEAQNDESGFAIEGLVIDAAKMPVAGAEVWLLGQDWRDEAAERRAETTTDEQGRFVFRQFTAEELFKPAAGQLLPSLLVRDERRRLGWAASLRETNARQVRIVLHEVGDFRGKLLDASGEPIAGARIQPRSLNADKLRDRGFEGITLPFDLIGPWQTKTSDDGGFVLRNVPVDGSMTARVATAGFGNPILHWDLGRDVEFRLARAGAIAGAIELPDDVEPPKQIALELRRQSEPPSAEAQFRLYYFTSAPVDEQGRFEFAELPPGSYVISLQHERNAPVYADPTPPLAVAAGQRVADVAFPLSRMAALSGVAVDNERKKPAQDVTLRFSRLDERGRLMYAAEATTDRDGRFETHVRPGKIIVEVWQSPPGYLLAARDVHKEPIDVTRDVETTIEIERSIMVKGMVVDDQGRPEPNAELHFIDLPRGNRFESSAPQQADASGEFELTDVDPSDNLPLRARSATAVTDGAVLLAPERLREPIRLQLREASVCRFTGRVIDEAGRPLAGVKVHVSGNRAYESQRISIRGLSTSVLVETLETDGDGRFTSGALWPRDSYEASVTVKGYARAQSQRLVGKPGETLDAGVIVLRRNDGFVAGSIVDSAGKPVEGVTVFNSGDGLEQASMITAADGRFRLQGLFGGPVYVFARKTGYRFAGLRTKAGAENVELKLLRDDEPPSAEQPAPEPANASQHEQLARWMLEQLWELPQQNDKWVLIRYMARIDADQAAKWSAQLNRQYDSQIAVGICERLEDVSRDPRSQLDVDDTLAAAASVSDNRAVRLLIDLAEQTSSLRPDDALRFVEEANLRLAKLLPPERVWTTAETGALLARLGRGDAGRKMLDEAALEAEKLGVDGRAALARGMVARELAVYDADRAVKLIDSIPAAADKHRYLSWLAEALAEHDLDRALELVKGIAGDANAEWRANHARLKIAYRIAPARLPEALNVVQSMSGEGAEKSRAEALAWVAFRIADRDQPRACELIDRSLAIYLDRPDAFRSWSNYGGRLVFAAWVARLAREIGYPDMHSVVMRVLAARPSMLDEYEPVRRLEASVAAAWILAFAAPETSRELLEAAEPFSELIGSGQSSIHRAEWVNAWALADPQHAKTIFLRELAAVRDNPDLNLQQTGLLRAAEMLSQPQSQWPRHLLVNFGPFWLPGED